MHMEWVVLCKIYSFFVKTLNFHYFFCLCYIYVLILQIVSKRLKIISKKKKTVRFGYGLIFVKTFCEQIK